MAQDEIETCLRAIIRNALCESLRQLNSNEGWARCAACAKFQDAVNQAHNFGFRVIVHETDITLAKIESAPAQRVFTQS
jgi:hypothetical protein